MVLLVASLCVEQGAGTGWTLEEVREFFYGDIEISKLFSMRGLQKVNKWDSLNKDEKFNIWLVGFTDGDGSFVITKSGGYYKLQYNLSQSKYNLRILHHIKSRLGYGSVSTSSKQTWGNFRITDRKVLNNVIFPIFDKYPLLTSKSFNYTRFKEAHSILENKNIATAAKNDIIEELLSVELPSNYISPALSHLTVDSSYDEISQVISVHWLAGFIEAEGNFGIFPDRGRFNIEFSLVQKLDKLLLELIKRYLHIKSIVKYNKSSGVHVLSSKNSRSISNIISIFTGQFKGMKSLEFKLWCKANYYKKTRLDKVSKIHKIILKIRGKSNVSL